MDNSLMESALPEDAAQVLIDCGIRTTADLIAVSRVPGAVDVLIRLTGTDGTELRRLLQESANSTPSRQIEVGQDFYVLPECGIVDGSPAEPQVDDRSEP